MNQLKLKKGDFILIIILLIVATLIYVGFMINRASIDKISAGESYAHIQVDGEIYQTVKLTKETQWIEIQTSNGYDLLRVRDYGIEVVESDCPQKICFTFGHITKLSEEIICLPLRMYITIISDIPIDNELDAIVS
ncbi:NusG domain II-containing protein [Brevibacillus daliensis]|uniref:NusG domain II-containing protein n=1 Tax=Brevibacillus daliensis TaxID=2892995 RepID=UPI001E5B55C2|nr:NusG domain II-containing protein [Brevibacillus daliensis]